MSRLFLLPGLILLLASCGGDDDMPAIFHKPPFAAMTDSIQNNPTNADLYYRRGALLYQSNMTDLAEEDLRKAWSLNPSEEYALSITTILQDRNTDSAILFLQEANRKLPNSIALQVGLARGYQQKGKTADAMAIADRIITQFPNQLDALLLRSELLKASNRNPEALATLEKAYAYAPFDAELTQMLAFEYAEAKNSRALALADSLIAMDTRQEHAEPYYFKGVYYSNTGNTAEAIRQFDLAIQHDYYFINAYVNKGIIHYEQKNYPEALKILQLASTVAPTEATVYYWLGKTKEALGNKPEAKLDYQRAFGLDKTLTEAKEAAEKL
jgi:tetratricopeptide (TPR) repeat protein